MITKPKVIIGAGIIGWLVVLVWSIVSYINFGANCNFLGRLNLAGIPWSLLFYPLFIASLAVSAFFAYTLIHSEAAVATVTHKKWLYAVGGLLLLAAILMPSLNTHDISFYFSAGKALSQGTNVFAQDWYMANMYACEPKGTNLNGIMYGPITLGFFTLVFNLSQGNFLAFVLVWKLLLLLGLFVSALVSWKIIQLLSNAKFEKLNFYLWWCVQPMIVWQWLGNGQFDVLWVVFVLLAILAAIKKYWWLVIILLVVGIWVKFIPLLMAPWFALWWWQDTNMSNWKQNLSQAAVGIMAGILMTYLLWNPFWQGPQILKPILLQTKWAVSSIFSASYYSLKPLFVQLFTEKAHWILTRALHAAVFLLALYFIYPLFKKAVLVLLKRTQWQPAQYVGAIFISMLIYLAIWQKSFWPWYISWLLPFGLIYLYLSPSIFLKKILIWLSIVPLLSFYIPWIYNHVLRGTDAPSELWFQYMIVLTVWVYPLVQLFKWRKLAYDSNIENKNQ
ncbi:MAG: hypothetical protein HYT15_02755 [Candidatus Magasanikbacteria bacterium]|nr:hypothetical protein [Candidatus Magasanikbacteria bacterium]